ncbi:PP2C family protein-serine/threonine phosphatase [Marinibacterium profundimaris]|uniref:Chemotaxis protein CheY n=1 Tax=Marinibacterium profundimaris TaxID=1679460 RepID=A0A225NMP2_9RHOB|nr:SpoIIE family protein phosphatase [Marinibacterium profundimaris]OWU75771.1 chemotaxis protein CheY [Marinibacterium profundimaris]
MGQNVGQTRDRDPDDAAPLRVLVVDDSQPQRRLLATLLKKWGYIVDEAASGEEALARAAESRPDVVMSDWMMPGMDGLQLCRQFRQRSAANYGYFILLTSKGKADDVARGLDAGADDFLTKPVNANELRARISAGERIIAMQRELSSQNEVIQATLRELQDAYDVIDRDLLQAKTIQESLVPDFDRAFDGGRVSLLLKPCGHIGGDLVGMFSPGPHRVGFYSIDVSGHGITSAMMTARIGSYLSNAHLEHNIAVARRFGRLNALRPPVSVARALNARLLADVGISEYFTMAYAIADLRRGIVRLVQAGHPHPLLIRADGEMRFVGQGGVPVGLIPGVSHDETVVRMQPGDRLLLYSDGFTEARLKTGGMLEEEGLLRLVSEAPPERCGRAFMDDLYDRLAGQMADGLDDDVSATLFEYTGTPSSD